MCIRGKRWRELAVGSHSRGDSTLVIRVKGEAQHNPLARKRLPDRSWPHHPVSNSLGPWEARTGKEETEGAHTCSLGTWWPQRTEYP